MTAPALDSLRDEIASEIFGKFYAISIATREVAADASRTVINTITRHIPADVLAGLLEGSMVAVPVKAEARVMQERDAEAACATQEPDHA